MARHPDFAPIRSAVEVIERAIPSDPGVAYTHCRGLLETACRTILADRGIEIEGEANANQLMSRTLKILKLTPESFDGDDRVEEGVEDLVRGINQLTNGVVALRNSQGIGPHGRDALEAVLDADYALIAAVAVDSVVALLFRLHRKQAENDPNSRSAHGAHPDFDRYLDERYPDIVIEEIPILASKALCLTEPVGYRQKLVEFKQRSAEASETDNIREGEALGEATNG